MEMKDLLHLRNFMLTVLVRSRSAVKF